MGGPAGRTATGDPFDAGAITRPDPALRTYFVVVALLTGPGFPFVLIPLLCRYHTLRYRFDDEGISVSWGVLWKREIVLTYRRIQDIHVRRNIIQRWLGLATVSIQTASGSASPEMSIDGVLRADELRDFLYAKMRGARDHHVPPNPGSPVGTAGGPPDGDVLAMLRDIRDSLRRAADRTSPGRTG